MSPRSRLSRRARIQLERLPPEIGAAVANAFTRLFADPWLAGKPLGGDLAGVWSMRVGSYRILYTVEGPESHATVVVRAVDHRRVVYRRPPA